MRTALAAITAAVVASSSFAAVQTKEVEYAHDGTTLQGFLAWDDAATGKRPGVLVVHEWWGHNEHARNQAKRLAEAGYVGFALDMYGKGKVTTHPNEAQAFMQEALGNLETLMGRFGKAKEILLADPHVDPEQTAAIGYCFGGGVVLGAARQGADFDAVVSFHGALGTESPAQPGAVKARVLALNGAADPMSPPEVVAKFEEEMNAAGAQFDVVNYPGAKHGFTNPAADAVGMDALAYDADADQKSWAAMLKLFEEVFSE